MKFDLVAYLALVELFSKALGIGLKDGEDYDAQHAPKRYPTPWDIPKPGPYKSRVF